MKKIISLFQRDYENDSQLVRNEVVPGAEWVIEGEGVATQKLDGTCCCIMSGDLYKRYTVKGKRKEPCLFIPTGNPDPITGKQTGWIFVDRAENENKWHIEAFEDLKKTLFVNGTYELCGPKVQGNPEKKEKHILIPHEKAPVFSDAPRTYEELKEWFIGKDIEGIVWHHSDDRMVKIKGKDFGIERGGK